jgi:hypothetical protein
MTRADKADANAATLRSALTARITPFEAFDLEPEMDSTSPRRDARIEKPPVSNRPSRQDDEPRDDAAIYSQRSEGVSSPIALRPQLPRQLSPNVNRSDLRVIELVISTLGTVESVRLIGDPRDVHDSMLLSAAKAWVFRPAEKNGVAGAVPKNRLRGPSELIAVMPNRAVAVPSIANIESASDARRRAAVWAVALFSVTIFLGSSLLFLVQPMFAKVALPWLGGSPSVWNTCILFFQTTLLLGYLYAHLSTRWLGCPPADLLPRGACARAAHRSAL